jgi:hypothetical protein
MMMTNLLKRNTSIVVNFGSQVVWQGPTLWRMFRQSARHPSLTRVCWREVTSVKIGMSRQ